jgi:conjugal transfer pilus assembly protein TraI
MLNRFFNWLFNLFRSDPGSSAGRAHGQHTQPIQTAPGVPEMPSVADDDPSRNVPRYPPFDSGIPVTSVEWVLASQSDLIDRIYRTAGVSRDEFAARYEPAIRNLARYVHLLPATDTKNHSGAGGLFHFALEIGLYSLQTANASVFPVGGGVERRFHMTPKWSLATFLAGICCQLYRTVGTMVVLTDKQDQWQPLLTRLYDWSVSMKTKRYFIRWLEDRNQAGAQASSSYIVNLIVPAEIMQYIAADNNLVLAAMSAAITGGVSADNPILEIINPITSRVVAEDGKRSLRNYGHMTVGTHLEPHLIDAMLRLVKSGAWTWNNRNAVIWIGADGVFIDWPQAAKQVVNLLIRAGYAGIPQDPDTLAGILGKCNMFEESPKGGKYWSITPSNMNEVLDTAVKLSNPKHIFPADFDFKPFAGITLALTTVPVKSPAPAPQASKAAPPAVQPGIASAAVAAPALIATSSLPLADDSPESAGPSLPEPPSYLDVPPDFDTDYGVAPNHNAKPSGQRERPPATPTPPPQQKGGQGNKPGEGKKKRPGGNGQPIVVPPAPAPRVVTPPPVMAKATTLPGPAAARLLGMLKEDNGRLLTDIFSSYEANTLTGVIASLPQGLGISHEEILGHGRPAMDFIQELADRQWLWVDKTKPTRNIHLLPAHGKETRMLVLKPDIAIGLGFRYEEAA